jgi:hypothetical protein
VFSSTFDQVTLPLLTGTLVMVQVTAAPLPVTLGIFTEPEDPDPLETTALLASVHDHVDVYPFNALPEPEAMASEKLYVSFATTGMGPSSTS